MTICQVFLPSSFQFRQRGFTKNVQQGSKRKELRREYSNGSKKSREHISPRRSVVFLVLWRLLCMLTINMCACVCVNMPCVCVCICVCLCVSVYKGQNVHFLAHVECWMHIFTYLDLHTYIYMHIYMYMNWRVFAYVCVNAHLTMYTYVSLLRSVVCLLFD